MNVPKLRFKEFNDKYKYRNLSDISTLIKDGTHGTHENYENGIPLLSAKNINNNKINIPENCRKISVDDYNKIYKNYLLKEDDILLTIVGSIGRTALYKNEKVAFQRSVATIRIDGNNNPNYIRQYIESPIIINQLNNMTNSSAQGGVYLSSLSKLNFDIPSKEEQLKVANFLSLLDKKIELQTKKIEDLKLFTKNTILNKLNNLENYNSYKFKDICNIQTGKSNTQDKCDDGIYPFYIRSENIEKSNKYIFDCEAVLTIGDGNIGKVFFYENGKFDCHQRVYVLNNFQNVLGKYAYYYFSSFFHKRAMSMSAKNTVDSVRLEMISDMLIKVPKQEEQVKMINLFSFLDKKIDLEKQKLNKLIDLKKGLTQNMFV